MFSSLFPSIQSPKSLLANKLASSLSTYFDIDPNSIQTSLAGDAKIELQNTRLKPLLVRRCLLVGSVERVEFSWKWGGSADGSTSFIRETVLSIEGIKVRLLSQWDSTTDGPEEVITPSCTDSSVPPGFLDYYVQQILDHLTVRISDVELSVEALDAKIVVGIDSIELFSLGRESYDSSEELMSSLSQTLSLESMKAYVTCNDDIFPLLEPFSYVCSVKRVSGRRFLNFEHGLEVTGDLGRLKNELQAFFCLHEIFK
jgi:hypothetical protein